MGTEGTNGDRGFSGNSFLREEKRENKHGAASGCNQKVRSHWSVGESHAVETNAAEYGLDVTFLRVVQLAR